MPGSAKQALLEAQRNGHKLFLCTGRGKAQIYPFLLDAGFDGIVAGAGAYVEYDGQVLFHETFGEKRIRKIVELFTACDISFLLQMSDGCAMTRRSLIRFIQSLGFPASDRGNTAPGRLRNQGDAALLQDDQVRTGRDDDQRRLKGTGDPADR